MVLAGIEPAISSTSRKCHATRPQDLHLFITQKYLNSLFYNFNNGK